MVADALASAPESGRDAVAARMERVSSQVRAHQARLADVDAGLAAHGKAKLEADWVGKTLARFERVWEAMAPPNRARLMRALIKKVEVDDRAGKLAVHLRDLAATLGQAAA